MATVRTRATLTFEVQVGTFDANWTVDSLKRDAKRALDTAMGHMASTMQNHGMTISKIETKGLIVEFNPE